MRRKEEKSVVSQSDYQVFSEVDLNHHGNVSSYMPAWTYDQLIYDLESDIKTEEIQVNRQNISPERIAELSRSIKTKKERLHDILSTRPKIDKTKLASLSEELGMKIADSMFTRSDMMRGTADAHTEARRMVEPCIKLSDEEANFAMGCNVVPNKDRMISRNQASKIWKIARKYIGESSNVEILRRG